MPVYSYECETCKSVFDVRHGMFFEEQRCVKCHSEDVYRLPSEIFLQTEKRGKIRSQNKPGKVVDEYIKDAKEEIKQEKKKLRSEEI